MRHHWLLDHIHESVSKLPERLTLCDLEAPAWLGGALVSALCFCCFLAHRVLYGIFVVLLFRFCFPLPYQSLGDTMLSSL